MNRVRAAVVLGAVLLWAVTPAMACLMPGMAPTPAERECCHHMAEHCGQSVMPASHTCCQAPSRPETLVQKQASVPVKHAVVVVPAAVQVFLPDVPPVSLAAFAFSESPPDPPSSLSSVLRI